MEYSSTTMLNTPQLDAIDLRLLALLQDDASLSNQDLAQAAHLSPATCHRRVKWLWDEGFIERQVSILSPHALAAVTGWGLSAMVEISLDRQTQETLDAFEQKVVADEGVQQVWRVSPGPDFVLVVHVQDMPAYQDLAKRLFNEDSNVRNVRTFFSIKRAKFETRLSLPA